MPIYHIVLFKLKQGITPGQISEFVGAAKSMVGKIHSLLSLESNIPHHSTAHRGQGFNMGLVAVLEKADDIKVYAEHPAHIEVQDIRAAICDDTLAYDLEY